LPFFAKAISNHYPAPYIWLAYLFTEFLLLVLSQIRYYYWMKKDKREEEKTEKKTLYVGVRPDQAIEASRMIRQFAKENGVEDRISYRMSLCMEEMAAYAVKSQDKDEIQIEAVCQFKPGEGSFFIMDDGKCIALNDNEETKKIITDNYGMLKRVSKSVEYQYILNMNYTVFRF
jgi:anti-sigma regulatory factor (Ser/Thr protein kinase)